MSRMSPYPRQKTDAKQESASVALEASDKVPQYVPQARTSQGKSKDGRKKAAGAGAHPEVLLLVIL
jgi:hypothetical protein